MKIRPSPSYVRNGDNNTPTKGNNVSTKGNLNDSLGYLGLRVRRMPLRANLSIYIN